MITCGNRQAHNGEIGFHHEVVEVKACFGLVVLCGWLYEADVMLFEGDEDEPPEWERQILSCTGVIVENPRGWTCTKGHDHVTVEVRHDEGWDYASDEEEAAHLRRHGVNAVAMNGGSI